MSSEVSVWGEGLFPHVIRSFCEGRAVFPTSSGVFVREGPFSPRYLSNLPAVAPLMLVQ
jgi:hypothetical protein